MESSGAAAILAKAYETYARAPSGRFLWYGPNYGANLTTTMFGSPGLAARVPRINFSREDDDRPHRAFTQ